MGATLGSYYDDRLIDRYFMMIAYSDDLCYNCTQRQVNTVFLVSACAFMFFIPLLHVLIALPAALQVRTIFICVS